MSTLSISEVVATAAKMATDEEKIAWLQRNNSQPLRTILTVMYNKDYVWNIPTEAPPYNKSVHVESHGMLYRQARKLRYFIKGFDGDNLPQVRREFLFIEMLESIDNADAEFMIQVLAQTPPEGLSVKVVNAGLGLAIPEPVEEEVKPKKRGRKAKVKDEQKAD